MGEAPRSFLWHLEIIRVEKRNGTKFCTMLLFADQPAVNGSIQPIRLALLVLTHRPAPHRSRFIPKKGCSFKVPQPQQATCPSVIPLAIAGTLAR